MNDIIFLLFAISGFTALLVIYSIIIKLYEKRLTYTPLWLLNWIERHKFDYIIENPPFRSLKWKNFY